MDASRYSWCLIAEHLYEASWNSYLANGSVAPHLKIALEELIKVDSVAEMLSDLNSEEKAVILLQKQVRSFECLANILESDNDWILKGDGRLTILYDAFFRLTFQKSAESVDAKIRKVMDQFLVQLVLGAWCSQGAMYASMAYSQMRNIVGLQNENFKTLLRSAFASELKTKSQISQADRILKSMLEDNKWEKFKSVFLAWLEEAFQPSKLIGSETKLTRLANVSLEKCDSGKTEPIEDDDVKEKKDLVLDEDIPWDCESMSFSPDEDAWSPDDPAHLVADINEALYSWMKNPNERDYPIPGIIIRCKAREIALRKGCRDFKTTPAWFNDFRTNYDLRPFYDPYAELRFPGAEECSGGHKVLLDFPSPQSHFQRYCYEDRGRQYEWRSPSKYRHRYTQDNWFSQGRRSFPAVRFEGEQSRPCENLSPQKEKLARLREKLCDWVGAQQEPVNSLEASPALHKICDEFIAICEINFEKLGLKKDEWLKEFLNTYKIDSHDAISEEQASHLSNSTLSISDKPLYISEQDSELVENKEDEKEIQTEIEEKCKALAEEAFRLNQLAKQSSDSSLEFGDHDYRQIESDSRDKKKQRSSRASSRVGSDRSKLEYRRSRSRHSRAASPDQFQDEERSWSCKRHKSEGRESRFRSRREPRGFHDGDGDVRQGPKEPLYHFRDDIKASERGRSTSSSTIEDGEQLETASRPRRSSQILNELINVELDVNRWIKANDADGSIGDVLRVKAYKFAVARGLDIDIGHFSEEWLANFKSRYLNVGEAEDEERKNENVGSSTSGEASKSSLAKMEKPATDPISSSTSKDSGFGDNGERAE